MPKRFVFALAAIIILMSQLTGCASPADGTNEISETETQGETSLNDSGFEGNIDAGGKDGTDGSEYVSTDGIENANIEGSEGKGSVIILHTNDVHCAVDANIGLPGVSALKKELEAEGKAVFLIDAGDEINGGFIGNLTRGESIIRIMNEVKYDLAVPGNHDFDYGMENLLKLSEAADFPYICCNIIDLKTGKPVFEPYRIEEIEGKKIAFIGVSTPRTFLETPVNYFEDEEGEPIYSFMQDEDGTALYNTIQAAVDEARGKGADICILVSHLGIKPEESPFTSTEAIENTTGIDFVIDAHSHSIVDSDMVKNKDGKEIPVSQCGYFAEAVGKITIDPEGRINSKLIQDYEKKDDEITAAIDRETKVYEAILAEEVGSSDFCLRAVDDTGSSLAKRQETNLGDFEADALRFATQADVAIVNGGNIHNNLEAGPVLYGHLYGVSSGGSKLCIRSVSGQELLDALEYGVKNAPNEFDGFLQVSGVTLEVDLSKDAGVLLDEEGRFIGFGKADRRVSNVFINGKALDPKKEYTLGGTTGILLKEGCGYTMFHGDKIKLKRYEDDALSLKEYLSSLEGKIPEEYRDEDGQGRIVYKSGHE